MSLPLSVTDCFNPLASLARLLLWAQLALGDLNPSWVHELHGCHAECQAHLCWKHANRHSNNKKAWQLSVSLSASPIFAPYRYMFWVCWGFLHASVFHRHLIQRVTCLQVAKAAKRHLEAGDYKADSAMEPWRTIDLFIQILSSLPLRWLTCCWPVAFDF